MKAWILTALAAMALLILSIPSYYLRTEVGTGNPALLNNSDISRFVGIEKCAECHRPAFQKWSESHHRHAMAMAKEESVRGDFNDAKFTHFGFTTKFYRRDGKFLVYTRGLEGKPGEFEITHTFGWYPLQQYLIPFDGGRLQCLPIAWDVRQERWYHLYPDRNIAPDSWLYWTNGAQNWNGMCAECHSTNLRKNFDSEEKTFDTRWSEISVGCEACHGPGGAHVDWAELPPMARAVAPNYKLRVKTSELTSRELVELCAPCHSRRATLGDYTHDEPDLLDSLLPSLLEPDLYFPDGQIKDEVYVYGSFTQSKMYHRDVRCSDCHDVHSIKTIKSGNNLCIQCHRASEYDTAAHHFHKKKGKKGDPIRSPDGAVLFAVGAGADCVGCHMPGRTYMGIDYRPDHSLRIPRPDLTIALGTPNGCTRCHYDKTAAWADEIITKWYGPGRKTHYGKTLAPPGQTGNNLSESRDEIIRLAGDALYPVIARATALARLENIEGTDATQMIRQSLSDEEALIRHTAVSVFPETMSPDIIAKQLGPLLFDPVKGVRIEAARKLAGDPSRRLRNDQKKAYETALAEYEDAMRYAADFAYARFNLGNLYSALGRTENAEEQYLEAISINDAFYPAKVNLAMTYNRQNKKTEALRLLREVYENNPAFSDIAYSIGLLLAEGRQYDSAIRYMKAAAEGMPNNVRARYNLGLLLQLAGNFQAAETAFLKALEISPEDRDALYALADHYFKRGMLNNAEKKITALLVRHPGDTRAKRLLAAIMDAITKQPDEQL